MISRLPRLAIVFWLAVVVPGLVRATEGNLRKEDKAQNPHRDSGLCSSCHMSDTGGRETLRFGGDISKLCRSCHDGGRARREVHVTGLKPSETMARRIPSKLPLEGGMLTCLSCHDMASVCKGGQGTASNHYFLRGNQTSDPLVFCFQCHAPESYRPFNPHDQLAAGKVKVDTCMWCHGGAPDVNAPPDQEGPQSLRATGADVCRNCHTVAADHPVRAHLGAVPPTPMVWYMSAYELKSKMRLPLARLLEYARTAQRVPRSIPLDEKGRITCYSCHNPHEKDLLPNWNPRAVGAEPKQAVNHRVRSREGPLCVACHQK